jgi:acetylornithine/N-succinyldiaminopimelate aminotransferase
MMLNPTYIGTKMTTSAVMPTYYSRLPIALDHGKGAWVYDTEGNKYLDALSGIAVTSLGHAHPKIVQAIGDQVSKVIHTSNTYQVPLQEKLAQELVEISAMDQVFFCNSGAEANETAIKITRCFAHQKNIHNPGIVVMEKAFHGRSMGTLSASNERIREGFEPFLPEFIRVPFNDLNALSLIANQHPHIVAVMVEPIQGEGGIHVPDFSFLAGIRKICNEHNWLMMVDEIQTGMGRTGKWFAHQHSGIVPDVMTLAKSLANGIPIGACLAKNQACNLFAPGKHGSTFGGNPLACRTALTVLDVMKAENLVERAAEMGAYLKQTLQEAFRSQSAVVDVRGEGLMLGVELDRPCRDLMAVGAKQGLLFNVTSNCIVRLLPPLIITKEEANEIAIRLNKAIEKFIQL